MRLAIRSAMHAKESVMRPARLVTPCATRATQLAIPFATFAVV
jgi:hypothetical protein